MMRWTSLRVRLTLWHVAVLGLVLVGFGVALSYSLSTNLSLAVDQELADRAHGAAAMLSGFERQRNPYAPPPMPDDGPPETGPELEPGATGPLDRLPTYSPPETSIAPTVPTPGSEQDRRGYYRKPQLLDLQGAPLIPFSGDRPWDPVLFQASALGGKENYTTVTLNGEPVRVFSIPIQGRRGVEGVIQVAHPLTEQSRLNTGLVRTLLTLIPLALLVAGVGGIFLTDRALRPVRRITQTAAQISAADLSGRLEVTEKDELGELASTFNAMIGRLDEAFQRLDEAYQQQRRFVGDASHELRTPLTTIKANTSLALSADPDLELYREALEAADEAADSMTRIVQDLLLLARSDGGQLKPELRPVDLGGLLERAAGVLKNREHAPICLEIPAGCTVTGDAHYLTRLFLNLLENAVRHTPVEGSITVSALTRDGRVEVRVTDTGEGIAPEHLPHLCERFYRVDSARARAQGGTGLGLAICRSIAEAHQGTLSVESTVGVGTTFTVRLPAAPTPAPVPACV